MIFIFYKPELFKKHNILNLEKNKDYLSMLLVIYAGVLE
jgi:hypothetical protein